MVGIKSVNFILHLVICSLCHVTCHGIEDQKVIHKSSVLEKDSTLEVSADVTENNTFAGGPVSIDCLRCLCLKSSNCLPTRCAFAQGTVACGYFRLTHDFWVDCKEHDKSISSDWRTCSNNLFCASKCIQNYMNMYAEQFKCFPNCEGYTRELAGGPNGCNNPNTVGFWERLQMIPGCKGVQ